MRRCEECGGPNDRPRSRWCSHRCKGHARQYERGPTCSACGRKMMAGPGVLMDGTAKCRECRRLDPKRPKWIPKTYTCWCGVKFTQSSGTQVYCTPMHSPSWNRNKKPRERKGRVGARWRKLRAQVLAEETHCWLCGEEVDVSLPAGFPGSPEADHVVPVGAGGAQEDRDNLRLSHRACNRRRKRPSPLR